MIIGNIKNFKNVKFENDNIKIKLDDYLKNASSVDESIINNRKIYLIHKI